MKSFSSTELRRDSAATYSEVEVNDIAIITHRDRPDMVLIRKDELKYSLSNVKAAMELFDKIGI
jgi:hypothetical protein